MMIFALIAAAMLAAAVPDEEAPVTTRGIGALRIGMPVAALRRLGALPVETPETAGGCHYWRLRLGERMQMMVVGDRLVRIDVTNPAYRTRRGVGVGMGEAEIRRVYRGAIRVQPHPDAASAGRYLVYRRDGDRYGLIIETDADARAESMRVGYWRNVQWTDGCA